MNWSSLDWSILGPALIAGLLVTATHVPLGMQVLARGIVFIDLAIAQIAGLGVVLADRMGFEAEGIAVQIAALVAALAGS
ncbi:MAG TPA: metal ABC transporter permease, partial [Usitatibacter sp.]|nr:metal ABC transporter permease [Usitatibacter sp.]